ncbi:YceI family protein [bacterium]|nr:YceI family protein [bacterium]
MRYTRIFLTVVISLLAINVAFSGDKYAIDVSHSHVGFAVKHMVITNTKGEFNDFSGTIVLNESDITKSSVELVIKTASIDTDNERRDNHLKSGDFFEVEKYPEITFKSTSVKKSGDGYVLTGALTIKDVTKEVSFPFELVGPVQGRRGKLIGAAASLMINRQDYGVSWSRTLDNGGLVVADNVKIELEIEAGEQKEGTN